MGSPTGDLAQLLTKLAASVPRERASLLVAHGDVDEVVVALADEAERLVMANLRQALDSTAALLSAADAAAGPTSRARARRAHAQALTYANRFDEALGILEEAVELSEEAGDRATAARARLTMVHALARLGRFDDAVAAGEAARDGFRACGDDQWAAKAEVNLGVTFRMMNDPVGALEHFDRALGPLAGDPVSVAHVDSSRADALLELNRFADAEAAFASARDAFERAGHTRGAAILEGNLADVLSRQGRLQGALYHFERARRRFEADRAEGDLARIKAEQAEAFAAAGLTVEAAAGYAEALGDLDTHGLALEAARTRASLGRALTVLGRYDEAAAMLEAGGRGYGGLDNTAGVGRIASLQGELAVARGDAALAIERLEAAVEYLADRPAEAAVAHRHLASAALATGDVDEADRRIALAMDAARVYNLAPLLAELLHLRATVRARRGLGEEAIEDLRAAVAEVDRIRGTLQADRLRAAYMESRTAVYEDLVTGLLDQPTPERLAEAFAVVEQARSRALLDLVAGIVESVPEDTDDGSAVLLGEVARARGDLNALYSRLPDPDPAGVSVRQWRRDMEDRERVLQDLEDRIASTRGIGGLFARPADAAGARALLDDDTVLIEYFTAGDEVLAFVLRRDSIGCVRNIAAVTELRDLVELTRFQIERALTYPPAVANTELLDDTRRELQDLHAILLAPLAGDIADTRRLVVIPHGLLHGVPFHALHDGSGYVIQRHEIVYSPSASLLGHLPQTPPAPAAGGSVVFGVADEDAPRIDDEVRAAAGILPGARAWTGPQVTWARLAEESAGAEVLHLACHGWFSPRRPLGSGVKLGDRWMTVRDIYGLRLAGAVVTLSGCETGRSAVAGGDEQVGLIRGFFAAGASALMMTLWPLHDETAAILVASIYDLWQNGSPDMQPGLGGALRAAQCRLMEENPHPIFWAPFILVGRP